MPYYKPLKELSIRERERIVDGLNRLRDQFSEVGFPGKKTSESLILGTWNIRNFDDDRFNYGPRSTEAFYYIAEIISRFDVLAVQEVCEDLRPLKRLLKILGREYDYIVTDVTHSGLGGNKERLGFIYDKNKVRFQGVAGEIVLPNKLLIGEESDELKRQFSRTPFGAEFQSGWFKFLFSTVHIYFGKSSKNTPQYRRRVQEIDRVANYLAKEAKASSSNQILVGDFNIIEHGSDGFNALEKNGFTVIKNRVGSNRDLTKFYDQISFLSRYNELNLVSEESHGVFQFFDSVYREEDFKKYKATMEKGLATKLEKARADLAAATSKRAKKSAEGQIKSLTAAGKTEASLEHYYGEWRTFQMSDHLPLWVELEIDFSGAYLDYLRRYRPS